MRESKIRSFVSGETVWVGGGEPEHPVRIVSGKFLNRTSAYGRFAPVSIARHYVLPSANGSMVVSPRLELIAITPGSLEQVDEVHPTAQADELEAIFEMIELQAMPLEYRVPNVLLLLANKDLRVDCNQFELSMVCGAKRESVNAALRPLNVQDIIWTRYGTIRIRDKEALIKACGPPESFRSKPAG